jgi:hypothetical protein
VGYRQISPEEVARTHLPSSGSPGADGVLQVRSGKLDGATRGFVAEDSKGDVYIVKLDPKDVPYLQSAVGIIANRLMWGAGYWVPEDYLVSIDSTKLTLAEDAEAEEGGEERPMTMDDVRRILANAYVLPDGRFRAVLSRFVPGKPKGPTFLHGVREDDPNDHYRHEHRRELRGLKVIAAWLNDTDRREGNMMDVFVEPGYLRHYQIDFGASLGSSTDRPKHPKDDIERPADLWRGLVRLFSLGFYQEGWEDDQGLVAHQAIGYVKAESFDPDEWRSSWDNPAFFAMRPADAYWGAKIVSSFTDAHLRAAVREGELPEAWVADTLTSVLALRRDAVVRRFFSSVTPLEDPHLDAHAAQGFTLTFSDLGVDKGVWAPASTSYSWTLEHAARGIEGSGTTAARTGRQRIEVGWGDGARPGQDLQGADALAVLEVLAVRDRYHMDGEDPRAARVWLRWNAAAGRYDVVALEH